MSVLNPRWLAFLASRGMTWRDVPRERIPRTTLNADFMQFIATQQRAFGKPIVGNQAAFDLFIGCGGLQLGLEFARESAA